MVCLSTTGLKCNVQCALCSSTVCTPRVFSPTLWEVLSFERSLHPMLWRLVKHVMGSMLPPAAAYNSHNLHNISHFQDARGQKNILS